MYRLSSIAPVVVAAGLLASHAHAEPTPASRPGAGVADLPILDPYPAPRPPPTESRLLDLGDDPEYAAARGTRRTGILLGCLLGIPGLAAVSYGSSLAYSGRLLGDSRTSRMALTMVGVGAAALAVGAGLGGALVYYGTRRMERRRTELLLGLPRVDVAVAPGGGGLALGWTY